jgi:hypothetical protein
MHFEREVVANKNELAENTIISRQPGGCDQNREQDAYYGPGKLSSPAPLVNNP